MGVAKPLIDEAFLCQFKPLDTLSPGLLAEAIAHSRIERLPPGRRIHWAKNAVQENVQYLLSGQLALLTEHGLVRTLKADAREALHPIGEMCPPGCTALARTSVTLLSIERACLDDLLRRNHRDKTGFSALPAIGPASPDISPPESPDRTSPCATKFSATAAAEIRPSPHEPLPYHAALTAPLFSRLPRPHLQVLKQRLTEVTVHAGEVVIREGETGDHYYFIVAGRCRVTRQAGRRSRPVVVAELGAGEGFGEGALIAHDRHDSTVTMVEQGRLLRLSKGEFLTLLVQPFIQWIPYGSLSVLRSQGAVLLDIRSTGVFRKKHLQGSINIPLNTLRQCAALLDRRKRYVICSDIARRGATAAFLLAQQGMDVRILDESMRTALRKDNEIPDSHQPGV